MVQFDDRRREKHTHKGHEVSRRVQLRLLLRAPEPALSKAEGCPFVVIKFPPGCTITFRPCLITNYVNNLLNSTAYDRQTAVLLVRDPSWP